MNIYEQAGVLDLACDLEGHSLSWKEKLALLGSDFLERTQVECPVTHRFAAGHYIREMKIPAGTLFIGRGHKHGHECVLVKGELVHITESGKHHRKPPYSLRTAPGYQVVLYAITDVIGESWHVDTGERDIDKLESEIFESPESFRELGLKVRKALEAKV